MVEPQKLHIVQGQSLGPFYLGATIHDILARIRSEADIFPTISVSYSQTHPLLAPIVVTLSQNGLRLRFDGADQRLRLIEVLDFGKTRLLYKDSDISRTTGPVESHATQIFAPKTGPPFKQVYKIFGPTTPGEYIPPKKRAAGDEMDLAASTSTADGSNEEDGTYVLSYPGIAFSFPVQHTTLLPSTTWASTVSLLSSHASRPCVALALFLGESWAQARGSLFDQDIPGSARIPLPPGMPRHLVPREVEIARIHPEASIVELLRRDAPSVKIRVGETTAQDLVSELGPPDAIHRNKDRRANIHRPRADSSAAGSRRGSNNLGEPGRGQVSGSPGSVFDADISGQDTEESDDEGEVVDLTGDERDEQAFYNYYSHGLDILIAAPTSNAAAGLIVPGALLRNQPKSPRIGTPESPALESVISRDSVAPIPAVAPLQPVVVKITIHGNVPGSWSFNRHRRLRWIIAPDTTKHTPSHSPSTHPQIDATVQLNSEMPFSRVKQELKDRFHSSYASAEEENAALLPMVLNRGWGGEDVAGDGEWNVMGRLEDSDGSVVGKNSSRKAEGEKLGGAEVYGFPSLIFEVLKNHAISAVMVY